MTLNPHKLPTRQRQLVLYLWAGLSPKEVASLMKLRPATIREKVGEVGKLLPGRSPPLQKILLWKADFAASNNYRVAED